MDVALLTALSAFEHELADQLRDQQAGLSVGVICDQDLIWTWNSGYADYEQQIFATSRTLYRLASVTKLFTATMLMHLRDAGKLRLDDALECYLPPDYQIRSPFPDATQPTLRQAVSHTAGLGDFPYDYEEASIFPGTEEFFTRFKETELLAAPMTEMIYSNFGITLLSYALERAAKQPYRQYVTEHILRPLDMRFSGFDITDEMRPYLAVGYDVQEKGEPLRSMLNAHQDIGVAAAANQLYSSVEELAHFVALQFYEGRADDAHILKGSTIREMHAPVLINPGWESATGIGWRLLHFKGHTILRHTGGAVGFSTAVMIVPALKLGIVALRNSSPDGKEPRNIAERGLELLMPVVEEIQARSTYAANNEASKEWYAYEGNYYRYSKYSREKIRKAVRIEHGKLLWYHGGNTMQSEFVSEGEQGSFRMKGGPFHRERAFFVMDEAGRVQHVKMGNRIFLRD